MKVYVVLYESADCKKVIDSIFLNKCDAEKYCNSMNNQMRDIMGADVLIFSYEEFPVHEYIN